MEHNNKNTFTKWSYILLYVKSGHDSFLMRFNRFRGDSKNQLYYELYNSFDLLITIIAASSGYTNCNSISCMIIKCTVCHLWSKASIRKLKPIVHLKMSLPFKKVYFQDVDKSLISQIFAWNSFYHKRKTALKFYFNP